MSFLTTFRFWKRIGVTMIGLLLLLFLGGFIFVQLAGGLSQLVEKQLNELSDRLVIQVSDARLGMQFSARPLIVSAYNITMEVHQSTLVIPAAEFEFGFQNFLNRQPGKLVLRGMELNLVKTSEGWQLPEIIGVAAPLLSAAEQSDAFVSGLVMRKIGIDAVRMTLNDATGVLPQVQFSDLYLDFESLTSGSLIGSIRGRQPSDGSEPGDFTATFTRWPGGKRFAIDITAHQLNLNDIVSYTDFVSPDLRRLGNLTGHIGVNVENSEVTHLDADIALQDGVLVRNGMFAETEYEAANVIGTYARSQKTLNIAKSDIVMADGRRFEFVGEFKDIGTSSLFFAGGIKAENISFQNILANWPNHAASEYKTFLSSHVDSGYITDGRAQIAGRIDVSNRAIAISKFDFDGRFSGLRANFASNQYQRAVGTVEGDIAVLLGSQGKIKNLRLDASVSDGSVLLAGHDKPVIVTAANLKTEFADGNFNLKNLNVDFARSGKLSMSTKFTVDEKMKIKSSSTQINTDDFDVVLFSSLWPKQATPKIKSWLQKNMLAGRIRNAELRVNTVYEEEIDEHQINNVGGNLRLQDTTLSWSEESPPFTKLGADLAINNAAFVANITTAHFGEMNVQHGKVKISPVVGSEAKHGVLSIAIRGALANAVDYAKKSGVTQLVDVDVSGLVASGEAEMILEAKFPLGKKINALTAIERLDATISNGSFSNVPGGVSVDDAELVIAFGNERSDVSGTASIMGAPCEFSLQFDRDKDLISAVALASPSSELAAILAKKFDLRIDGRLGGKLVYSGDLAKNTAELQFAAPLSGVSLDVPSLNWAKLPAEAGQVSMVIDIRGGELAAINNIDIVAGSLVAQGQIAFDSSGAVQAGFFERVAWPGNDIRDLIIESNPDKSWRIGASAKIIDLVPLRRNRGVSGGETINFDFTADQIIVDNQISLSGQLVGSRSADGAGTADFSGSLLVRGEPLIAEAQFGIAFGSGDETIFGTGLIGGGETNFNYVDSAFGKPKLILASKNGGRLLSGLDITDTVRGGDIRLVTIFESEDFKTYNTRINIENFSVVEAPRAIRALSVLSLAGLYALVEGDGTGFRNGLAELETNGAVVNIKSLKASGDAVALSMIGLYDRGTKQVDVSGNLVPASQVSNLVGKLPLLGNVLTGIDKTGIFTTQFSVTGHSDDMKTSINVASVAPGVLRDLLSPNWLRKESNRLFDEKDTMANDVIPKKTTSQLTQ